MSRNGCYIPRSKKRKEKKGKKKKENRYPR